VPAPSWERSLLALFDDLEQQADGLHLDEREHEAAALATAGFAEVSLESRLLASLGRELVLQLPASLRLRGRLANAGVGWVLLVDPQGRSWIVRTAAVLSVAGAGLRAVPEESRIVLHGLRVGSALRHLAEDGHRAVLHLVDGTRLEGSLGRVGRDFVELDTVVDTRLVPFSALAAVSSGAA
jgi:hypothetical protein